MPLGYYEDPEATEAAFTEDGYFRTGDIVAQDADGYLTFLERAKELIVLSTGKNVAPTAIEDAFSASELVEQCMVIGEDQKFVGALIVPNLDAVRSWAEANDLLTPSLKKKRRNILERYSAQVGDIYAEDDEVEQAAAR